MSKGNNKVLGMFQKLGKAMMTPVAVMPAAAILNRLGAADVLDLPWMAGAGAAIFDNLAIIFAVGIAIGLAKQNNGTAGLAGLVSMYMITTLLSSGAVAGITGKEAAPAFAKIMGAFKKEAESKLYCFDL